MANERGRLYDADNANTYLLNDDTAKTRIMREEIDIQGGLTKKPLPLSSSRKAVHEGIWGRSRTITIEGIKIGTQTQIETFIGYIEGWINVGGLLNPWEYYPLFHKDNSAGVGSQNQKYDVLPDSFNYVCEIKDVGYVLHYTLVLYEGISVRDFIA